MTQKLHLEFGRLCKKKVKRVFSHPFASTVVSGNKFLYLYIIALNIKTDVCKKIK